MDFKVDVGLFVRVGKWAKAITELITKLKEGFTQIFTNPDLSFSYITSYMFVKYNFTHLIFQALCIIMLSLVYLYILRSEHLQKSWFFIDKKKYNFSTKSYLINYAKNLHRRKN